MATATPKAAANRSRVDEFIDLIRRVPRESFVEMFKSSPITVDEQRTLLKLFLELK